MGKILNCFPKIQTSLPSLGLPPLSKWATLPVINGISIYGMNYGLHMDYKPLTKSGWWFQPSWKIWVRQWVSDDIPNMKWNKIHSCLKPPTRDGMHIQAGYPRSFRTRPLDFLWPDPSCRANGHKDHAGEAGEAEGAEAHGGRFEPCLCKTNYGISMVYYNHT